METIRGRIGRWFVAAVAFASAATCSGMAHADGGLPRAYGILFEPGNPSHIIVHSQYWGLFDGHDGSSSWPLLCSEAFGGRALDADDYDTVVARGGRVLVASQFSGLNVSDDYCDWRRIDAFNGEPVRSIAPIDATGTSFIALTVLGNGDSVTSRLYTSKDRGDTWTALEGTIPQNTSMSNVAVAPGHPERIYVVGGVINGGPRRIAVSRDGGASFATSLLGPPNQYDASLAKPLSVAGVVANDPDTLFVRANGSDSSGEEEPDELWMTRDAGQTWNRIVSGKGDLPGFAFTPDGKDVLIAGPTAGITRMSLADLKNGGSASTTVYARPAWGLAFQGNALYAGTDDYGMKPSFTVGVSTDGGMTFQKVMTKCDVVFPTCAMGSTTEMVCREQWTRPGGYSTDYLEHACVQDMVSSPGGSGGVPFDAGVASVTQEGGRATDGGPSTGTSPKATGGRDGSGDARLWVGVNSSNCSVGSLRTGVAPLATLLSAAAASGIRIRRSGRRSKRR